MKIVKSDCLQFVKIISGYDMRRTATSVLLDSDEISNMAETKWRNEIFRRERKIMSAAGISNEIYIYDRLCVGNLISIVLTQ